MAFLTTKNLKGDIFGGLTAGIVALPLALAFGIQAFGGVNDPSAASIGALAGIVGATLLGFFAAMFGGTYSQISGPTGPMTVITASLISAAWAYSHGNLAVVLLSMSLAGMFCGIFQIIFGLVRMGKYVRYIPYPVLSGFMSGIGVIIILQQIYPLIGLKSPVMVVDMIAQLHEKLGEVTTFTPLFLGIGTIAIIQLFPLVTKKIPSTLVALVVMTLVSMYVGIDAKMTIGDIPAGLPSPFFAKLELSGIDWWNIIVGSMVPGLTLAGLGSIDTLLTSVVADSLTKTRHDPNRELIGQGIGNTLAGMFCGIAGAGATMRTVVNVKSGGRTQLSGMVHALLLLAILLGLGSLVKYVPLSVLAGILITVGWGIIDFKGFRDLRRITQADAVVMLIVFFTTVFLDLLTAVGIGMVVACVIFMKRASDLTEGNYKSMAATHASSPFRKADDIPTEFKEKIFIENFDGPIFFGNVTGFNSAMQHIPEEAQIVILRMRYVSFMDQSGVYALETAVTELKERGVLVLMTLGQQQPHEILQKMKVIPNVIPADNVFETTHEAVDYLRTKM